MTTTDQRPPRSRGQLTLPTPALVTMLQTAQGYPTVSLLMTTTPAARMLPPDAARLTGLLRDAGNRLSDEGLPGVDTTVLKPLAHLVSQATHGPATAAIALYSSAAVQATVHLPVEVNDRVVIDPTFATRDLVRALHRTPRHVVLALSLHEARLFDGIGDDLRPAPVRSFPRTVPGQHSGRHRDGDEPDDGDASTPTQTTHPGGGAPRRLIRPAERRGFYREVDRALGSYLRVNPAPLVLIGTERVLAEYMRLSTNLSRLAGCIRGSMVTSPTTELASKIHLVMNNYLRSRQREALALLDRRLSAGRVATGIHAAWLAARSERPEMLAVEDSYFYPARLDPDGDLVTPATDTEHPDVIDDLIDELIEQVLRRGGWVALLDDGTLDHQQRVALTLRP